MEVSLVSITIPRESEGFFLSDSYQGEEMEKKAKRMEMKMSRSVHFSI